MKKITIGKKEFSLPQVMGFALSIVLIIGLGAGIFVNISQLRRHEANEAALNKAVDECVKYCDYVYAQMGRSDDTALLARKEAVSNAKTAIGKYNAANRLMSGTEHVYTYEYLSKADMDYANNADPNDYTENQNYKKRIEVQTELYAKHNDLKIARDSYSLLVKKK